MAIASFGAVIPSSMDTDRMIPTSSQNGSPGSQDSAVNPGSGQQPPLTFSQQQQFMASSSMPRKKKSERLVPPAPILGHADALGIGGVMASYANQPSYVGTGNGGGGGGGGGGILVNSGHTNHGFNQDGGYVT